MSFPTTFVGSALEPQLAVVLLGFFVPLALLIIERAAVYDTIRQFLFLIPSMILLALYGGVQIYRYLIARKRKTLAIVLVALAVLGYSLVVKVNPSIHM